MGWKTWGCRASEIRERVKEALETLGIVHLRDRETHLLSGGEKQKVALAGVLAMRPNVLLLDEPLASLDPASAQEALALIRRLADEGISILLVEHRVEDALRIRPDRVILMEKGRIAYDGSMEGMMEVVDPTPGQAARADGDGPRGRDGSLRTQRRYRLPRRAARRPRRRWCAFEDVSFGYGEDGPTVLHDVDLTVRQGDIVALLGPNGAGKTTLVKHAIGLLKPRQRHGAASRDAIRKDLSVAQIAHTLGYVFQSPSHMLFAPTVREELAFGPKNLGFGEETIAAERGPRRRDGQPGGHGRLCAAGALLWPAKAGQHCRDPGHAHPRSW